MTLVDDYARQYRWRSWALVLDALSNIDGQVVLDLGCGIGDLAVELSARGASVIGVDGNEDFVQFASSRGIRNAEFRVADLRSFREPGLRVDGIWSSFTTAYFPALPETLRAWGEHLRPGGWIALTEIDDLFGHHPLSDRTRELLNGYVGDSLLNARYDFLMGRKMADYLRQVNFTVSTAFTVPDAELSFVGAAPPEVIAAWRTRFDRMGLLREFCGTDFQSVKDDFLNCLGRYDHWCAATVQCCIACMNNTGAKRADEQSVGHGAADSAVANG